MLLGHALGHAISLIAVGILVLHGISECMEPVNQASARPIHAGLQYRDVTVGKGPMPPIGEAHDVAVFRCKHGFVPLTRPPSPRVHMLFEILLK